MAPCPERRRCSSTSRVRCAWTGAHAAGGRGAGQPQGAHAAAAAGRPSRDRPDRCGNRRRPVAGGGAGGSGRRASPRWSAGCAGCSAATPSSAGARATGSGAWTPTWTAPGGCSSTPSGPLPPPPVAGAPAALRLLATRCGRPSPRRTTSGRRPSGPRSACSGAAPGSCWHGRRWRPGGRRRRGGRPRRAGRGPARRGGRPAADARAPRPAICPPRPCASTSGCAGRSPTSSAPIRRRRPAPCTRRRCAGRNRRRPRTSRGRRPTGSGWPAATPSSRRFAPPGSAPAGTPRAARGALRRARVSARAGCWRSWRPTPGGPAERCCPGAPSRGSGRCSPSPSWTRWPGGREPAGRPGAAAAAGAGSSGRLVPELAPFTGAPPARPRRVPAVERSQSFAAVAGSCGAWPPAGPVLLVVDDLQRAGRSTLELLHYLARHLGREQLLSRPPSGAGRARTSRNSCGAVATTVPVGPLRPGRRRPPRRPGRAREPGTRGHAAHRRPSAVRRRGAACAVRTGDAGLPASVQTAVIERVARTGAETERLMRAAAVLGAAFDPRHRRGAGRRARRGTALTRVRARAARPGCWSWRAAGCTSSRTTSSGRCCSPTTPSPTRLAWHTRAADLLSADPEAVAPARGGHRRPAARSPCLAERGGARRWPGSWPATRSCSPPGRPRWPCELEDGELAGRALVVRGRADDAAAHFAAAWHDFTAARAAARRAGDRRLEMTVLRELAGDVPVALGRPPADCEPMLARGWRWPGRWATRAWRPTSSTG